MILTMVTIQSVLIISFLFLYRISFIDSSWCIGELSGGIFYFKAALQRVIKILIKFIHLLFYCRSLHKVSIMWRIFFMLLFSRDPNYPEYASIDCSIASQVFIYEKNSKFFFDWTVSALFFQNAALIRMFNKNVVQSIADPKPLLAFGLEVINNKVMHYLYYYYYY